MITTSQRAVCALHMRMQSTGKCQQLQWPHFIVAVSASTRYARKWGRREYRGNRGETVIMGTEFTVVPWGRGYRWDGGQRPL